ncbi:sialic acid-binding Ig-like lectin 5 isoform X2 [Lemur catta]|uniref:sialic acid-binding Ig-like lectin 5 isoform X2 n=1 Tax=Lemur catta TaxID=9447 RepID=UPI001E26736B|nr:sialic acid-binding Ig-like lectin 5 isoform X2 [Lemur catta]
MLALLLLPLLWGGSLQDTGYQPQVKKSVTVQEGLCVLVPCSFSYPPWTSWYAFNPVYLHWFRDEDRIYYNDVVATNKPNRAVKTGTKGRFLLLGDVRTRNCSLSIRDAKIEDTGTYFFQVESSNSAKHTYENDKLYLQVTALTEKPDIHSLEPVESGRPTNLSCSLPGSCEGGRPLTFSWTGAALKSLDPDTLHSSAITFTPRSQDHGTNLTCQVKLQGSHVTTERTVQLNVSYAPRNLTISIFTNGTALQITQNTLSLPILEGQALQLLCAADSNPPAQLSWFQGTPALNATPISNTGNLELPRGVSAEGGEFTCQAQHPLGSLNFSLSFSVHYPPQLLGPSCSWEAEGLLRCSCCSRARPAPSLRWRLGEGLWLGNGSHGSFRATPSSAGPWANSSLSHQGELSSGLRLSCEAWNAHGTRSGTVLLLPGKSVLGAGVVSAALAGAGAMALFSVCVCLIFFCIMKTRRKQAARRPEGRDDDPVMGTAAWGSRQKPWPDSPPEQDSPAGDTQPSGEQELYYASVSFQEMKVKEPQDQKARNTTEYSEIKTSK